MSNRARQRLNLNEEETKILIAIYNKGKYPSTPEKKAVSRQFGVALKQIHNWFSNRRKNDNKLCARCKQFPPEGTSHRCFDAVQIPASGFAPHVVPGMGSRHNLVPSSVADQQFPPFVPEQQQFPYGSRSGQPIPPTSPVHSPLVPYEDTDDDMDMVHRLEQTTPSARLSRNTVGLSGLFGNPAKSDAPSLPVDESPLEAGRSAGSAIPKRVSSRSLFPGGLNTNAAPDVSPITATSTSYAGSLIVGSGGAHERLREKRRRNTPVFDRKRNRIVSSSDTDGTSVRPAPKRNRRVISSVESGE